MNEIGGLSPNPPKNNQNTEFKIKIKKANNQNPRSVNSSELSNSSNEKEKQNLNLKENKFDNKESDNKNVINIQYTSSKKISTRKQTESNTNIVNESGLVNKDKLSTLVLSQFGNKNTNGVNNTILKLTNNEKEFIMQILYQHFLFKYMNNKIISNLINNFEIEKCEQNNILYEENSLGEKFYIVKEGTLEETFNNSLPSKQYHENDTFGDLALLQQAQREGTITAKENCILFSLRGNLFRKIVQKINKEEQKERFDFLSIVPIFQFMDKTQLNSIVLNMYTRSYESGNIIFKEGDIGYSLFIIKSGEVNCESKNGEIKRILKSKDHFGEYAVLFYIPR